MSRPATRTRETVFGYGQHQGLAVSDGKIFAAWSSNENEGSPNGDKVPLAIVDSVLTIAGGPADRLEHRWARSACRATRSTPPSPPMGRRSPTASRSPSTDRSTRPPSWPMARPRRLARATSGSSIRTPTRRVTLDNTKSLHVTSGESRRTSTLTPPNLPGEPIVDGTVSLSLSGYSNLSAITVDPDHAQRPDLHRPGQHDPQGPVRTRRSPTRLVRPAGEHRRRSGERQGRHGQLSSLTKLTINPNGQAGVSLVNWEVKLNGISTGLRVLSVQPVADLADPLDDGTLGYTTFKVIFQPLNPDNGVTTSVGTYSYVVRPNVSDRIRQVGAPILTPGVTGLVVTGPSNAAASPTGGDLDRTCHRGPATPTRCLSPTPTAMAFGHRSVPQRGPSSPEP